MTSDRAWSWCAGLALVVGVFLLRDLPGIWAHSPYDQWGWIAALLWLSNAAAWLAIKGAQVSPGWSGAGLIFLILGVMVDISFVVQVGFILLALSQPRLKLWQRGVFLVTALSWMPVLGWLGSGWASSSEMGFLRFGLAMSGGIIWLEKKT